MKTVSFNHETAEQDKITLEAIVGSAPESGYSIDQVRLGIKAIDRLKAAKGGDVEFEDAEFAFVVERVSKMKWTVADAKVIDFYDAVMGGN